MTRLILASASPARLSTLRAAGVEPQVRPSGVDEDAVLAAAVADRGKLTTAETALVLARAKAEAVPAEDALVLGCDSVLELDGQMFGKPADSADAVHLWRVMRGGTGVLHTGHWLVDLRTNGNGKRTSRGTGGVASTTVHFADVADDEIDAYVATGEPLQVAGAFTIDGLGGPYVTGVEGDHHAVVGLSLPLLRTLLGEFGVRWHSMWSGYSSVPDDDQPISR